VTRSNPPGRRRLETLSGRALWAEPTEPCLPAGTRTFSFKNLPEQAKFFNPLALVFHFLLEAVEKLWKTPHFCHSGLDPESS